MKKLGFFLTFILTTCLYIIPAYASGGASKDDTHCVYVVAYNNGSDGYELCGFQGYENEIVQAPGMSAFFTIQGSLPAGYSQPKANFNSSYTLDEVVNYYYEQTQSFSYGGTFSANYNKSIVTIYVIRGSITNNLQDVNVIQYHFPDPEPPEPDSNWLSDMWEWFLWQLGINDDYSGDIDAWITGGDREPIEYVTPTPSPVPPSPTPYNLNIVDPNTGNPVYEITGIPGSTTIINGGDTYNGSDFDIFAVDLQIGDGGTSNPKDGLNSVMESSNNYLQDVDITPVQNSFSIIPNDWFLLIGILAALPFIAGFIMRLLK